MHRPQYRGAPSLRSLPLPATPYNTPLAVSIHAALPARMQPANWRQVLEAASGGGGGSPPPCWAVGSRPADAASFLRGL